MADESVLSFGYKDAGAEAGIEKLDAAKRTLADPAGFAELRTAVDEVEKQVDELEQTVEQYGATSRKTKESQDQLATSVEKLALKFAGWGLVLKIVRENVADLQPALDRSREMLIEWGKSLGIENIGEFISGLERLVNPTKIVASILEQTQRVADRWAEGVTGASTAVLTLAESAEDLERRRAGFDNLREFLNDVRSAGPEFEARSKQIAFAIEQMTKSGEMQGAAAGVIKAELKSLLDQADALGVAVPADLQRIADSLGVVSTAAKRAGDEREKAAEKAAAAEKRSVEEAERNAERYKAAVEAQVSAITGGAGSLDQLEERTAILRGTVDSLIERNTISADQQVRLGEIVRGLVADYKAMTDTPVPEWLERLAKILPKTASETDKQRKAQAELNTELERSADLAREQAESAERAAGDAASRIAELESKPTLELDELEELNRLKDERVDLDRQAAQAAQAAAAANSRLAAAQEEVEATTKDSLAAYFEQERAAIRARLGITDLTEATRPMTGEALAAAAGLEEMGDQTERSAVRMQKLTDGTWEFAGVAERVDKVQKDSAESSEGLSKSRAELADSTRDLAKEERSLGDEASTVAEAFRDTDGMLDRINPKLETMLDLLRRCREQAAGISIA